MKEVFKKLGFITGIESEAGVRTGLPAMIVTLDNGAPFKLGTLSIEDARALLDAFNGGRFRYELRIGIEPEEGEQ